MSVSELIKMSNEIKKKKFLGKVVNRIKEIPEYETIAVDPQRSHGGKIDFSETDEEELHDEEPHSLFPPSSPKNEHNYLRRLPSILRRTASGRAGFKTGEIKLSEIKEDWWGGIIKVEQDLESDDPLMLYVLHDLMSSIREAQVEVMEHPRIAYNKVKGLSTSDEALDVWEAKIHKKADEIRLRLGELNKEVHTMVREMQGITKVAIGEHER